MTTEERALLDSKIFAVTTTTRRLLAVDEAQARKERADRIRAMAKAHGTTPQEMFTGIIPLAKG